MIRVALLIPTLDRSGAEKQLTLLATHLPRDEFELHVIVLTRGGPYADTLREHGIPVTILNKRLKFDPCALWRLRQTIKEIDPDILHTWLFAANSYGRLIAGKRLRPKVIVSERCVDSWKAGWQLWLDRQQIPRTTRLIGNSNAVVDFYAEHGFPRDRMAVVPNGIELPVRVCDDEDAGTERARLLSEFGIPPGAKIVGYVGRLARQKRLEDLVWCMELLHQLDRRAHFLIVGDGPEKDRLIEFAASIRRSECVHFIGHRDDMPRLWPLIDVFWLASDFEGQSNSIMEAMAAGIPVIASNIPPNRELVIDGDTGYLVKVGDRAGFAQFAERLLADPELATKLGTAGRERMQTEFSIEQMVAKHAELYRTIAANNSGSQL